LNPLPPQSTLEEEEPSQGAFAATDAPKIRVLRPHILTFEVGFCRGASLGCLYFPAFGACALTLRPSRGVLVHLPVAQAEFSASDSLWAPVLQPTSGWRLVDINHTMPTTTFNKKALPCIQKELELQALMDKVAQDTGSDSEEEGPEGASGQEEKKADKTKTGGRKGRGSAK
jgi:hypothetical protein